MQLAASFTWPLGPTASWRGSVAAHLGIFEDVMASDGAVNLTGSHKLQHLEQRFAADGFDYIGNALPDLPLLQGAQRGHARQP